MIPKRVKQFYINVTDKMTQEDYKYVKSIINEEEFKLFNKLLKSEQKHSVRIAKYIENIIDNNLIDDSEIINNKKLLIKVALLHDVGKSRKAINVIDKSIIVILNKLTKGKLRNFKKSKKIQCYYNHGEYSYELLSKVTDDKKLLEIIRNHHKDTNDKLTKFFKLSDDKN